MKTRVSGPLAWIVGLATVAFIVLVFDVMAEPIALIYTALYSDITLDTEAQTTIDFIYGDVMNKWPYMFIIVVGVWMLMRSFKKEHDTGRYYYPPPGGG